MNITQVKIKRTISITVICLVAFQLSYSQTYLTEEVIKRAEFYLNQTVGDSAIQYFKIDPDSYYAYKTKRGKTKWESILKGKKTKGDFSSGKSIRFLINHPEFPYLYIDKRISVNLDSNLNLINDINISKVPRFILENRQSDWLSENQLDSLIKSQNLKKGIKPLTKRLEFDFKTNQYKWNVFNILYEEKYYSEEEILKIHPVTGEIMEHFETEAHVVH